MYPFHKSLVSGIIPAVLAGFLLFFISSCTFHNTSLPEAPKSGRSFSSSFILYIDDPSQKGKRSRLAPFLSDYAINDLDRMLEDFGSEGILQACNLFPEGGLEKLLHIQNEDLFMMALHSTVSAYDYLKVLNGVFSLNKEKLLSSVLKSKSRYTGGLMTLEQIDILHFDAVLKAFKETLPPGVFLHSFYDDPYLLASAVRIIARKDPDGKSLKKFLQLVPNNLNFAELFTDDLPGLVVAFSTIQEVSAGRDIGWARDTLDITGEHLTRLILQKPANLAYILYGGHRIGIENFKNIIDDIGRDRFGVILDKHSGWLANFLAGMKKTSSLSTDANFSEISTAEEKITNNHPYLLQFHNHFPPQWSRVAELFFHLPSTDVFLDSDDPATQTRIYLLGLLAVYQHILYEKMPDAMLTPLQFDMLKQQILYSTRFSKHLDNMLSNFEVGRAMVEDIEMETFILLLSHELAHQIYSVSGFDAPLLSATTIHECSADIAANAIAAKLKFHRGLQEYKERYVVVDDYSLDKAMGEDDLLRHNDPHKIGRTQLGYIIRGLGNKKVSLDWETLFSVNLSVLKDKTKMKHFSYIRDVVSGYIFYNTMERASYKTLIDFIETYAHSYGLTTLVEESQIARTDTVEEMIIIARSLMLQASLSS